MCSAYRWFIARLLGVSVLVLAVAPGLSAEVTYRLGPATELLDEAFYAGQPEDGSDVLGRMAWFPSASGDSRTAAFLGYNPGILSVAVFLVDIGDPSSWRRLSDYVPEQAIPVRWVPDDRFIVAGSYWISTETGAMSTPEICGYAIRMPSATRLLSNNWLISEEPADNLVALPVQSNGEVDPTREAVIITDVTAAGRRMECPVIAANGNLVVFAYFANTPAGAGPDVGDIYVLFGLEEILAAEKRPGTDVSSLAPTSLSDPRFAPVRADQTENFTHLPHFSEDNSLVFFTEDWNNLFNVEDFFPTLDVSDFDVMIANADGSGEPFRFVEPDSQFHAVATPGGTRILYNNYTAGVCRILASTLDVITSIEGTTVGDPADNVILTDVEQEASDASRTVVEIPAATTIDFPDDAAQEVQITTPIDPVTVPQLPPGVEGIPVVREFGPEGTTFSQPITVTISYTDAEVAGCNEWQLRVFMYNDETGVFDIEVTTIVERDLANNRISFTIDHFSTFGLGVPSPYADRDGDGLTDGQETRDLNPETPEVDNPFDPDDPDSTGNNFDPNPDEVFDGRNDWDGDGMSNADEFQWGFNPIDPASFGQVPVTSTTGFYVLALAALGLGVARVRRARKSR